MKKTILNLVAAFLLAFGITLTIFSLTILNEHFVITTIKSCQGYEVIKTNIEKRLQEKGYQDYTLSIDDIKQDVDSYVKHHFAEDYLASNKIKTADEASIQEVSRIYNDEITLQQIGKKYHLKKNRYYIYLGTLLSIFIIGNFFLHTKKKHHLAMILIMSFFFLVGIYGVLYLTINFNEIILTKIFERYLHFLLGIGIILLEVGVIKWKKERQN